MTPSTASKDILVHVSDSKFCQLSNELKVTVLVLMVTEISPMKVCLINGALACLSVHLVRIGGPTYDFIVHGLHMLHWFNIYRECTRQRVDWKS
jgi:hypothetical protein